MVTIRDIAQRLGIAVSTVSKGLNGAPDVSAETRQLVLDTAVEMGYAAKRARRQAQPKVCVLVENMEYANIGQFGYEIVAGFRLAAAARGWAVDVLPTTPEAQARTKYGSLLLEGGYGGAFILGLTPQDAYMRALAGTGTPTVLLDNCVPNASVGYVGTDSWEGVELGVRHLAGLGHRKIAFLNGQVDIVEDGCLLFIIDIRKVFHGDEAFLRRLQLIHAVVRSHFLFFEGIEDAPRYEEAQSRKIHERRDDGIQGADDDD